MLLIGVWFAVVFVADCSYYVCPVCCMCDLFACVGASCLAFFCDRLLFVLLCCFMCCHMLSCCLCSVPPAVLVCLICVCWLVFVVLDLCY